MSSFWHTFGLSAVSAVETILEKDSFSLEELLDEDEVLQETRAENQKLLDFLVQRSTLEKLFHYVTVEPPEDADNVRKFKYPFISCELLCVDNWTISDAVFEGEPLISTLYDFLRQDVPLNASLAAHVSKVAGVLLEKKVPETLSYLKSLDNMAGVFLRHINSPAVMDLLLKIISVDSEETPTAQWLSDQDLIPRLVDMMSPAGDEEGRIESAARALCDIVQVSVNSPSSVLIQVLESDAVVSSLLGHMFSDAAGSETSLYHGLDLLGELLRRHLQPSLDTDTPIEEAPAPIRAILAYLDSFHSILDKKRPVLKLSSGELEPLGFMRLKVISFCVPLFSTNLKCVNNTLAEHALLDVVLESLFRFEWNNFLHREVESLVTALLNSDPALTVALVTKFKLASRLAASDAQSQARFGATDTGVRHGNTGYVVLLTTALLQRARELPELKEALDASEGWSEYIGGGYTEHKEREGASTKGESMFDSDSDSDADDKWNKPFGDSSSSSEEPVGAVSEQFTFGRAALWQEDSSEDSDYEDLSLDEDNSEDLEGEDEDDNSDERVPSGRPVSSISEVLPEEEQNPQLAMAGSPVGGTLPPLNNLNPEKQTESQAEGEEEKEKEKHENGAEEGEGEKSSTILTRATPDGDALRSTPHPLSVAELRKEETGNEYGTPPPNRSKSPVNLKAKDDEKEKGDEAGKEMKKDD